LYVYTYICAVAPSLEEEIQQKQFHCQYEKLMVNLLYTGSWMKNFHTDLLKEFGLSVAQFNILRILKGQYPKPATINLLIDRMLDKNSNASRLVDKLETKGYVERKASEKDRRRVEVLITDKGLIELKKANVTVATALDRMKKLKLEDVTRVNETLDELRTK